LIDCVIVFEQTPEESKKNAQLVQKYH